MKLNIQLFGGRGASSSSTINIQQLRETEKNLRERMEKIYNDNSGFARTDLKSVQSAREEWYDLKKDADKIRNKINEEEDKRIKNATPQTTKTFVNSYGEATTRNITSSTYERQKRRREQAVRRNLGL